LEKLAMESSKNPNAAAGEEAFQFRMGLNDNKAGMEGLDKEKINKIIMEATKGSRFYENELKKDEQVNLRIEKMMQQKAQITDQQLKNSELQNRKGVCPRWRSAKTGPPALRRLDPKERLAARLGEAWRLLPSRRAPPGDPCRSAAALVGAVPLLRESGIRPRSLGRGCGATEGHACGDAPDIWDYGTGRAWDEGPGGSVKTDSEESFPVTKGFLTSLFNSLRGDIQELRRDISQEVKELRGEVSSVGERVSQLEDSEIPRGEEVAGLQQEVVRLREQQYLLQMAVEDLENRSRRQNIHIRGAPVGAEKEDIVDYVVDLFRSLLGADETQEVVLDRVHRVGRAGGPGDRPPGHPSLSP
ncbi:hypothetical protein NDU88_004626, partial [Pleurodeles waltl]